MREGTIPDAVVVSGEVGADIRRVGSRSCRCHG
jgi:hypothetical protein